jgi:hypothetical protein
VQEAQIERVVTIDPWRAVCAAVFVDEGRWAIEVWGAVEWKDAKRRARWRGGCARWANLPSGHELWVKDVARPFGVAPNDYYGIDLS